MDDGFIKAIVTVAFVVVSVGIVASMYANDDPDRNAVESQGFTDVKIGDWAPLACSKNDTTSKHFTATNVQGKRVSGVVCCGVLKSCTVRF